MPSPYASFLDSSTDLGGQSHAAWNDNGVLLHAVWDPDAGRWGDAAQIANATSARNIQLTPGRTVEGLPLLLASWEAGEGNDANLFTSVGFHEGDGRLVWSDVVEFRGNAQADTNHRVGVNAAGQFVISNEVRQSAEASQALDAGYQDSEIASTVLEVKRRASQADGIAEDAVAGQPIQILTLEENERLLRVQANGQWYRFEPDNKSLVLPRLGELSHSAGTSSALNFTPNADFAAGQGSIQFSFEKITPANLLSRRSFELFADKQPQQQSYQLQVREPGAAFETLPLGFSQAINRERITRDAFASLVPRRGGSSTFRELAGDGLFGDRAGRAVLRRLDATAAAQAAPMQAQDAMPVSDDLRTGDEAAMDPVTGPSMQAAAPTNGPSQRYQQTYRDSFSWGTQVSGQVGPFDGSLSVGGTFFDRYELAPNLPIAWSITLADVSKSVDGALIPLGQIGEKYGGNFQLAFTGSTSYVKTIDAVGYRSRLSVAIGNAVQAGDTGAKDLPRAKDDNQSGIVKELTRDNDFKKRIRARNASDDKRISVQFGGLFGVPWLQRLSVNFQTKAQYGFGSTSEGIRVNRNPRSALFSLGFGATFGAELRVKLGDFRSVKEGGEADSESVVDKKGGTLNDFTLLQARAGVTLNTLQRVGITSDNPSVETGDGFGEVLAYKNDSSNARLRGVVDSDASRLAFNIIGWSNVARIGLGGVVGAGSRKNDFGQFLLPGNRGQQDLSKKSADYQTRDKMVANSRGTGQVINGALGIVQNVPWIYAFAQGIYEVGDSAFSNPSRRSLFGQFDATGQVSVEASLFNRMIGLKGAAGMLVDAGISGGISGIDAGKVNFFTRGELFSRFLYTLAGIDYTLLNAKIKLWDVGTDPEELDEGLTFASFAFAPPAAFVGLIDYSPAAEPALGPTGLNPELRPEGAWPVVDLTGEAADRIVAESQLGGRLVRAFIALPEADAISPADLNADGSLRNLRLQLTSPGAVQVVIDRRAFSAQPLAYDSPEPWQELLRDGDPSTATRTLSTAVINGARPGDRIPVYIDRRAALDAGGQSPQLQIGLVFGADAAYRGGVNGASQLLLPALPDSPTLSQRQGSSFVLGVADIPRPQGASESTDPYLAGLVLQNPGSGYLGTFDFVVNTGTDQAAQARALISASETGFLDRIDLLRPGLSQAGSTLATFRQQLQDLLSGRNPFRTRLASGSTAQISVRVDAEGRPISLQIASGDQGSGYLGGGSGSFYQRLVQGDRELLFKVTIRDGLATAAALLGSRGTFADAERFAFNDDDASGGSGEGARLLPVVRDWRLLNLVDEQDIAIGSDLRFDSNGKLTSGAWLTYTQAAPIGDEQKPISAQGARIDQPVRIGRFEEDTWKPYALQPQTAGKPSPGVNGFNIDPVIAELIGSNISSPDQVLVFSHADTSMIRSEDDLYLLDQALLRSDLYYSYRTGSGNSFPAATTVPIQLPAGVTLGLTNNRPYLTPFDNSGGARINPSARNLPDSVLLAWLSSSTPQSFDDDVTIAVTIGTSNGDSISWSPVDLIDPGDGISNDDIVNLSLAYQDGLPVLSWSVLTEQPYRAQVLEDEPLLYLRLDEPSGSDSVEALGTFAGGSGRVVRADQLADYSSPLPFQLVAGDAGTLQSLDDGVLWDAAMGVGDPNQAMRFRGGEYLELTNPLAVQALQDQQAPSGFGVELWIRPQADGQGRLLDGSVLDAGLYNPTAQLPVAGSVTLAFEVVRQAATNEEGLLGWRYVLQLAADSQANLSGARSSGLSPYNLATVLQAQTLRASFPGGEQVFQVPELLLNGAVSYQTRGGALSNLFSGPSATPLWEEFRADAAVSAEQVRQGLSSDPVRTSPLPLRFEQIQGWSLRQRNGELVFSWGEGAAGAPLELRSTALKAGDWNHVQIGYGFVDAYAELNGNTGKRATLVINGQLVASADDLGMPVSVEGDTIVDYAGFDFNALPLQLGYGYRGDLDELALFNAPLEDLERSSQARQASRFVDPRSASDATFFSQGRWDGNGRRWDWADPEKFTYSSYLGASEASINRRANGQQVIDIAGAGLERGLRADGVPDALLKARLPIGLGLGLIPIGSRLSGIRIQSADGVFAVGDGIKAGETLSGLVGVLANNTPTNALINDKADPTKLDLPILSEASDLRLAYASRADYLRGYDPSTNRTADPVVTYYYKTPQQQLTSSDSFSPLNAGSTVSLINNPSSEALERGSRFFDFKLTAKAIVQRSAPTNLAEINSGFQVTLSAEPTARNRYADQLEVGRLGGRRFAAILNGQADLEGGSSILVLDLSATTEADLQKLRKLDAGEASLAGDTRNALVAAGLQGLRISTAAGRSIGSTLLWADLEGKGEQSLIIGNPEANRGNGEVWVISAAYLKQVSSGSRGIVLGDELLRAQQGSVRRLRLSEPAEQQADPAGFGTSLAFGTIASARGPELLIGAPGQKNSTGERRDGAVWRLGAARLLNSGSPELLASGEDYNTSGSGSQQQSGLEFGTTLALAQLNGAAAPATLLVGLPGLEATTSLRNGGNPAASADQNAFYREVLRTTAPRDSEPPASETVTVQAGGVLALDLDGNKQVLLVGESFGGEDARAGEGLASGGSLDGDNRADVAIGLPEVDNATGAVAVVRGQDLQRWLAAATSGQRAEFKASNTRSLITSQAMYIHGLEIGSRLGRILRLDGNLVGVGQTNANELVIGDPQAADGTGEIHVLSGLSLGSNNQQEYTASNLVLDGVVFHQLAIPDPKGRLTLTPGRSFAGFGTAVAFGNVNGTPSGGGSLDDLVMASSKLGSTLSVLYGKESLRNRDRLDLRDIASGQGLEFVVTNQSTDPRFGGAAFMADINGDGYGDALLAKNFTSLEVAYGASTEAGASHPDAGTGGTASLDLGGQLGRLQGPAPILPGLARGGLIKPLRLQIQSVQAVGDLDGDGASELMLRSGFRDRLMEGETLGVGESLISANGKYMLTMQGDGNLVICTQIEGKQRRELFTLINNPMFSAGTLGGSVLKIENGELVYQRPPGFSRTILDFGSGRTNYLRQNLNGDNELATGIYSPTADRANRGELFKALILQDDGNLVAYGKPGGVTAPATVDQSVYFALQPAPAEIQRQAQAGAVIAPDNPTSVRLQNQSLLFSGPANSNASLAAGQVLEAIEIPADLRERGIRELGPYIGTLPINGIQTLLFAHPKAGSGLSADQLLLVRPNPDFRARYADTANLLRTWGIDVRANDELKAQIEAIISQFQVAASTSLEDRYAAALANMSLAREQLEARAVGLGVNFEQAVAAAAPLYRVEARTLTDPSRNEPVSDVSQFVLADPNGDGNPELLVKYNIGNSTSRGALALANIPTEASSLQIRNLVISPIFNSAPLLNQLRPIGDVNGDGYQDLITLGGRRAGLNTLESVPQIILGAGSRNNSLELFQGSYLLGGKRSADFLAAGAGDVNGDGVDDFLVEAEGGFHVVFGQAVGQGGVDPFGQGDVDLTSNQSLSLYIANDLVGWRLSDLRGGMDVNGDGLSDIQVTLGSDSNPAEQRSYLLFGGDFSQARTAARAGSYLGQLTQSINLMGTIGFDSLRGTPAGETAIGREGDDLLNGQGGPDVLNGGPGNDVAIVADDQFRRVDGGPGEDALLLNGFRDQAWDLTRLASGGRLANLETIDISDFGANTLRLNTAALLAISDSRRTLTIEGDAPTRAPLQQLMVLLEKANPRFAAEFDAYLDRKGITDEDLRIANEGQNLVPAYGTLLAEFWDDYNRSRSRELQAAFDQANNDFDGRGGPGAFQQLVAEREKPVRALWPEFISSQRDVLRQQLEAELSQPQDTLLLADGPNELRLDPNAPDLVLGSDRYWVYEALNGAARLLVADGIQVRRSSEVGTGLIPTPWTEPSTATAAPAAALVRSAEPAVFSAAAAMPLQGEPVSEQVGAARFSLQEEPSIPVARARPEDQDFSVDTPVVSDSERRITFTVQRTGYLDETSRLAFRVLGYTAGLVPAGYGQVVFAPGETHRTLQVPIIELEVGAEQLPSTEVSVELIPLEPGSPGPRGTASYAINGLDSATETLADPVRPLPAELLSARQLLERGIGLPLSSSLTSRERLLSPDSEEVVFGLSGLQGPGANDVWLQRRGGGFVSIHDPSLRDSLRHLQDSFEEQDGDLFVAVRDGGELDGDGQRDGSVDLTALPVLSSPGTVLLDGLVLRAPSRGDGALWLQLAAVPAALAGAELLFVPVLDQNGSVPSGEQPLQPSDAGYREALTAWIATAPAALRRVSLTGASISRALELQADTDYRVLLRGADGLLRLPAIREEASSQGRSLQRLRLEGEGVDMGVELSSNRWVMAGVAGAEALLVARYQAGSSAESPLELALVRSDGLSGGFDGDGDGAVDARPGEAGHLPLLAARLAEADGAVILSARQGRALLPFSAGDALLPVLFEGISAEAWRQLPAEQRGLSGPGWRLWIDGQDQTERRLQRQGVTRWQLADGGLLEIDLAPVSRPGEAEETATTRRHLGGAERLRLEALGYDPQAVSDQQLDLPLPRRTDDGPRAPGSWATLDTQALAGRLWQRATGLGADVLPAVVDLTGEQPLPLPGVIGPWGGMTARFYALHGQARDTVSLSGGSDAAPGRQPLRLTLAARASLPTLMATESGLRLIDGSATAEAAADASPAPLQSGCGDVSIQLLAASAGARLELTDRTYYLLADGAVDPEPAADPASPSRQLLTQLGVPLFQTSRELDQYFEQGGADTGLFRTAQQLPLGRGFRLVALDAAAASGEVLRPLGGEGDPESDLSFAAADGTRLTVALAPAAGLDAFLARDQGLAPVLNAQGGDQIIGLELAISREAELASVLGFHKVLDAAGSVRDPISGTLLRPGEVGYAAAALAESNRIGLPQGLRVDDRSVTRQRLDLAADALVVPYAQLESGETHFAYAAANPGGFARFRRLGDNRFGYEDLPAAVSDLDYDDAIVQITTLS